MDKDSDELQQLSARNSRISGGSSFIPRFSSDRMELEWQEQDRSPYWTNPQLRLSMLNRANVAMFPFSETRPIPDSPQNEDMGLLRDHGGSVQSNLSRCFVFFF